MIFEKYSFHLTNLWLVKRGSISLLFIFSIGGFLSFVVQISTGLQNSFHVIYKSKPNSIPTEVYNAWVSGLPRCKNMWYFFFVSLAGAGVGLLFNCLLALLSILCFTSSVSLTGSYTEDELKSPSAVECSPSVYGFMLGNLRSYDGCCNEKFNVTLKQTFEIAEVFCDYSKLVPLCKLGDLHFR